ncbi:Na(+)-translocating NADH-quinone reductase subunit C [Rheinheimera sp. F8]|uniref:Na(+)-translocating NADH-quinone reductase subunit C n=1 Tax=Rheinheimera sp. F8 TaxID=1763998 RepID=UPI0007449AC3|nr:Na(+)-translocating NADH-quinone reductase subunit C [Rheinheimera sp. F8]ALZ77158.1 NADH:ubiquinone reductase (Na(+)-transporting) subunit C [Rheinheimera sp. F8]
MSNTNESIGKTFFVVIGLCLICAIFVAASAVGLRPKQTENKLLDAQKNILLAVGMLQGEDIKTQFDKHVQIRLVDLETGEFVEQDPLTYDYRKMMKDPSGSIALDEQDDKAKIKTRAKIAPVYLAYADGVESKNISFVVLPIHGYGLWSTMHGFLALDKDGNTIKGLNYYEHGETPGLGGEIQNPQWVAQFVGKKLLDDAGQPAIKILKPGNANATAASEVDGLSGATLTSNGVQNTFTFWSGAKGFAPFLAKVRQGALNNG